MRLLSLSLCFSFLAFVSCAHAPETYGTDLRALVKKKAAFELACSEAQLTLTELSTNDLSNMAGSGVQKSFGVEGCGNRATYSAYCSHPMMMGEMCDATQSSTPIAVSPAR